MIFSFDFDKAKKYVSDICLISCLFELRLTSYFPDETGVRYILDRLMVLLKRLGVGQDSTYTGLYKLHRLSFPPPFLGDVN